MINKTELQQQLAALGAGYRQQLAHELPELLQLLNEPLSDRLRQQLEQRLHKIAGSAGTFGHAELGEQARTLELQCREQDNLSLLHKHLKYGIGHMQRLLDSTQSDQPATPKTPELPGSVMSAASHRIALLVPNNALSAQIGNTLGSFGYQVHLAEQIPVAGDDQQPDYDALIIDLDPLPDARATLQQLAQQQPTQPLPLLAISSDNSFELQLLAVRAGASGFFSKPVDLTALENRLENSLNSHQQSPARVLVVDDDEQLATRYLTVLSAAGMRCEHLQDPTLLLHTMHRFQPDVVLMDINMPSVNGAELARLIRLHDSWLRVPVIYLSAESDSTRQLAALLQAGDDFISKPISGQRLLTSVTARVQRARSISQALSRDSLTGLLKHADIKEQIGLECERALRQRQPLSLIMLDIDHFKRVNDTYGHAAGDNVIRGLANLLRQRLRKLDRIGRYGGEEFVALLPNCAANDAATVIDDIRQSFSQLLFSGPEGTFQCSFSAGIACCAAPDWDATELLERADQQLYAAKHAGRNRVILEQR